MSNKENISAEVKEASIAQQRRQKLLGALFVAISAVAWGFSGTIAQYLTQWQGVQVEWLNCVRMLGAAVLLVPLALSRKDTRSEIKQVFRNKTDLRDTFIYAIFGAFACQIGYLYTIAYTNSGTATMFEQAGMILVVAYTCITVRRKPTRREIIALLLALGGTFCLCTQGNLGSIALPPQGLAWGLFAAVGMATYVVLPVRLLEKYQGLTITTLAMCMAGVVITLFFQPWNIMPTLSAQVVIGTFATIILGTVLAYLLFLEGVKRVGAIIGGLLDAIEPVTAIVVSALWLGTIVTGWDALGCVLIVGMLILITIPEKDV